jgi:hypothetical protein
MGAATDGAGLQAFDPARGTVTAVAEGTR